MRSQKKKIILCMHKFQYRGIVYFIVLCFIAKKKKILDNQ